jgi:ABC-type transport system substrate-binding protein
MGTAARSVPLALLVAIALVSTVTVGAAPSAPVAVGSRSVLAVDGTPRAGRSVVIVADDRPSTAKPSGEQTLRIAGPGDDPTSLDPALARDLGTSFLCRQLFRGLTRLAGGIDPVPELADRIEIDAAGLVYTFRLRADAVFHDGTPITADDVVFSLTRAVTPATVAGDAPLLAGPAYLSDVLGARDAIAGRTDRLEGVRAIDSRTVEVRLAAPRATFLTKLAGPPAAIVDRRDVARGGDWWRAPNGSGPFRVATWEPEERLVLTRHAGFVPAPAPLSRVEIRLGANAASPFNLYQADEIDLTEVPSFAVERAEDPAGELRDELTITPQLAVAYLAFGPKAPPMDDPHVRRAVALAFPRDKVARVAYDGHKLAADGLLPPGTLGRNWPVEDPPHDLAAARRELAASTYGAAAAVPPIRVYGAATGGGEALRDVLAADLGLRVEVVSVEWPEFNEGLRERAYPAYELYWGADFPDPESFLWALFGGDSPDNYLAYRNDAFDALLREAADTLDPAARAEIYARAHQMLIDDGVVLPLFHDVDYTVAKPYVRGLEVTPLGILGLEGVWLER